LCPNHLFFFDREIRDSALFEPPSRRAVAAAVQHSPPAKMPGLQLALPLPQLNDLYSEDDEIFRVGSWALPATPGDDTESSGEDAPPLCAVFGWAEEEDTPAASSESSEDGSEGAAPRRGGGEGVVHHVFQRVVPTPPPPRATGRRAAFSLALTSPPPPRQRSQSSSSRRAGAPRRRRRSSPGAVHPPAR
jgi:hypothetical protein